MKKKTSVWFVSPHLSVFLILLLREYPEPSADHDPSPNTGDHKGVIFQSCPCPPPAEYVRLRFKGRWETSEALFHLYPPPLPSLSPASSGAALWGCHNCGLYNMGYCWPWLVTVDEAFKEASPLMVSVKILKSRSKAPAPRQLQAK